MRKFYLLLLCLISVAVGYAQTTVSIKLNSNGEDATIDNFHPAQNNPNEIEYYSGSWTINGTPVIWRNLFKFDFSVLPPNALIQSAYLNLYFAPANNFGAQDTSMTNSNESVLQRVTGPWNEGSVNWVNQPLTTTQNEVVLQASTSPVEDYLMTDVTALVQDIFYSGTNDGFLLKLQNEIPYARLIFASGDYPDQSLHPELIVTYTQCTTLTLTDAGEDATIDNFNPGNNYPNEIELTSNAWTINGTPVLWRSLMKFDFSAIPSNAIITNSKLSLFHADTNNFSNGSHLSLSNSNESVLMQVVDPWNENTVTWNNQPNPTAFNQVILPQSTSGTQDYTDMDVTAMVQSMFATSNFGFLLKLSNETQYARLIFASGDNPHSNKHPQLEVCYSVPTSITENSNNDLEWSVYPNPSSGEFYVITKQATLIEVYNSAGQLVFKEGKHNLQGENFGRINLNEMSPGIYCVRIFSGSRWLSKKVVIN